MLQYQWRIPRDTLWHKPTVHYHAHHIITLTDKVTEIWMYFLINDANPWTANCKLCSVKVSRSVNYCISTTIQVTLKKCNAVQTVSLLESMRTTNLSLQISISERGHKNEHKIPPTWSKQAEKPLNMRALHISKHLAMHVLGLCSMLISESGINGTLYSFIMTMLTV